MKVLFIRYKKSGEILEGGEKATQQHFDSISEIVGNDNITTYFIHDETKKRGISSYLQGAFLFLFNYFFGLSPKRIKEITRLATDYDIVFIDRSVFGILAKKLKQSGYKGKIITFFHNVEVSYFKAKLNNVLYAPLITKCANNNDRMSCEYSDKIITLNKRDSNEIKRLYGRSSDFTLPITIDDSISPDIDTTALTSKKPLCVFLGAYFTANNEGILWFIKNVMPHVDIDMIVVGKGMAKLKKEEPLLKDIRVESDVPNLAPYFEKADIMVLPIFKGSGMKVKTCESLMHGKNIIGTTEAFEGYNVDYEKVGALCNTSQDFINAINDFIKSPRPRFNEYSRRVYLDNFSHATALRSFEKIIE